MIKFLALKTLTTKIVVGFGKLFHKHTILVVSGLNPLLYTILVN